ncbi:MAG: hypothetical protein E7310_03685 [Clostridiales bacterium]|nr:hypothetical protein [Clostridiales bacterium]
MEKFRKIIFAIILIISSFFLSGCDDNQLENDYSDTKEKVIEEMRYLDTRIVDTLNSLNNITLENYSVSSKEITTTTQSTQGSGQESEGKSETSTTNAQGSSSSSSSTENSSKDEKISVSEMKKEAMILTDVNDIDWKNIKNQIELINSFWAIIAIDLYSFNVNNEDITGFNIALDKAILSIKDENKKEALTNLTEMYSYIPKYLKAVSAENSIQNIYQTKEHILTAYALVERDDWNGITTRVNEARNSFNNIMNDTDYTNKNKYKVDKAYILINDLAAAISNNDATIFYMKYKNVIQALNVM